MKKRANLSGRTATGRIKKGYRLSKGGRLSKVAPRKRARKKVKRRA